MAPVKVHPDYPVEFERDGDGFIVDHAPRPGPQYWDFRCLTCAEPVKSHGGFIRRWRWRRSRR